MFRMHGACAKKKNMPCFHGWAIRRPRAFPVTEPADFPKTSQPGKQDEKISSNQKLQKIGWICLRTCSCT